MNIMTFITNNLLHCKLCIGHEEKYVEETVSAEFIGSQIDNHTNRKTHMEQMIPKLCGACYAVGLMVHISNIDTLQPVFYYAYFDFIIKYGMILGG
jgi:hypothetical protein